MFALNAFTLISLSLILISYKLSFIKCIEENTVSVRLKNGLINGKIETTFDGKQLNVFKGIPYAEPPVGDLRFKKPLPVKQWSEPIDALHWPNPCYQSEKLVKLSYENNNFSEDCLYLNIWSPIDSMTSDSTLKSVMFFIHGGAFLFGSASQDMYPGQILAAKGDVVLITFNYRLSTFGFLYTGTDYAPGNVGLWDQALALEWVYDNIRYFGGDPQQITIFGESAGSWSVSLLVLSPVSRHLYRNAIMNSGAYVNHLMDETPEVSLKKWLRGVELIGCRDEEQNQNKFTLKIIDCLRTIGPELLARIPDLPELNTRLIKFFTVVVVDGEFLPQKSFEMLRTGDFKQNLNLMISTTEDEGSSTLFLYYDSDRYHPISAQNLTFNEALDELRVLANDFPSPLPLNGQEVAKVYFTGLSNQTDFDLLRRTIGIAVGDYYLTCPTIEFAKQVFRNSKSQNNVFQYLYNSKAQEIFFCAKWMGVCHASDLIPMFGLPFVSIANYSNRDREISAQIIDILTHFAKTGSPPAQNGVVWPGYYTINDNIIAPYYEITTDQNWNSFANNFKHNECNYLWNKYIS